MIWQFGELGYDVSIDDPCRVCNKPILWDYYNDINRKNLYQVFSALTNLKTSYEAFSTTNFELNVAGRYKRINLYHNTMDVVVLGNFDVTTGSLDPAFSKTGMWYEYFSGDSLEVTDVNASIDLLPGAYIIYRTKRLTTPDIALDVIKHPDISLDFSVEAFPNPSTDIFNISIYAELPTTVDVSIYDMSGRVISRLASQLRVSGMQVIQWNGKSTAGTEIESGLYFVKIHSPRGSQVLKIIRQ